MSADADTATDTTFQPPEVLQPVLTGLRERFADAIKEVSGHRGEVTVELDPAQLVEVATWLRDHPAARARPGRRGSSTRSRTGWSGPIPTSATRSSASWSTVAS